MDYTIIKPKTVYTVTLKTYPEVYKCDGCGYSQVAKNKFGHRKATCINPCGCYREFNTETKAREWLDKIEKYESSVDAGLLTGAGEKFIPEYPHCDDPFPSSER